MGWKDDEARRAYQKKWREANREKVRENNKKYRKRNKVRINDLQRKTYQQCRDTEKSSTLRRKYGITLADYKRILSDQGGGCAICGRDEAHGVTPCGDRRSYLDVDHCHEAGEVRGILCSRCNKVLGMLHDDPALFLRAAEYLVTFAQGRRPHVPPPSLFDRIVDATEDTTDVA